MLSLGDTRAKYRAGARRESPEAKCSGVAGGDTSALAYDAHLSLSQYHHLMRFQRVNGTNGSCCLAG